MGIIEFFKKPNAFNPVGLEKPNMDAFEPLFKKYEDSVGGPEGKFDYLQAAADMDQMFILNLESISEYIVHSMTRETHRKFVEKIKDVDTTAAACGWMVGRDFAAKDHELKQRLSEQYIITKDDLPNEAQYLINRAAYYPYYLFASVFIPYYESPYGKRTKFQKENHLKDTHRWFVTKVIETFQKGIQYEV
jgi:hypothetical protein